MITTDQKYKEYLQVLETLSRRRKNGKNWDLTKKNERSWSVHRAVFRIQESVAVISAKREGKEVFLKICTSWRWREKLIPYVVIIRQICRR